MTRPLAESVVHRFHCRFAWPQPRFDAAQAESVPSLGMLLWFGSTVTVYRPTATVDEGAIVVKRLGASKSVGFEDPKTDLTGELLRSRVQRNCGLVFSPN
jgi:hypothetical protein